MIRTTAQVQWDAAAVAVVDEVLALRLMPDAVREEVARRLGVDIVSDKALRNGWERVMRRTDPAARFSYRGAATSSKPAPTPHTVRGLGHVEPEPVTQRSERVPSVTGGEHVAAPMPAVGAVDGTETACRAFVAPMQPKPFTATAHERVLVIPDVHIPVNDKAATDLAIAIGFALKPTTIVVLGDTLDFAPLSFHQRTSKVHSLREEIDGGRAFFRALEQIGAANLLITLGNHEFRLDRYIHGHAPAIADLDGMSVDAMLGLSANGWRVVPYHDGIRVGGVYYTHEVGHCGIHAVRTSGDRMATPIVIGHVHSLTGVEMHSIDGEARGAWSFGWLGDMDHIDYRHRDKARRDWPHAVGIVYGDEHNNAWATPVVMRDRSRVANVHGRVVRA